MLTKLRSIFIFFLFASASAFAAFGVRPDGHLDMQAIRKSYMESDFVPVREALESYMRAHKKDATRDERVFAHIYLGVIYAADSTMDVKAENHFNALMEIAPNIELVDMFVPPKIQNIFDRVKRDYLRTKDYERKYDALGNPIPNPSDSAANAAQPGVAKNPPATKSPQKKTALKDDSENHAWLWWTLGGVAAVGAGVGIYVLTTGSGNSSSTNTSVGF